MALISPRSSAGHENDPTFVPPPHDDQLWRDVVVANVKDKAGFFEAVAKLSEKDPVWPVGDLEQVVVQSDTATGRAKLTFVPSAGEPRPTVDKIDKTFKFRRVNGGWLLDSL